MEKRKGRGERGGEKTTLGERVVNVEGGDTNREWKKARKNPVGLNWD